MGINYIYFAENTGYGIAGRELIRAIRAEGVHVEETRMLPGDPKQGGHVLQGRESGAAGGVIIHTVPEYYPYWLRLRKAAQPSRPVWGYTTWETDRIPSHWPALLNRLDGLFVTSAWNKDVFEACGVRCPIRVLPHVSQFHGRAPAGGDGDAGSGGKNDGGSGASLATTELIRLASGKVVFYHIGVWSERKATEDLLHAYYKEFARGEPVLLVLKTGEVDWSSYRPRWRRWGRPAFRRAAERFAEISRGYPSSAQAIHLHEAVSDDDIALLHSVGDCFVSLARGEGWGMGAYEAAWFGKAVAVTAFSGHLDYLPPHLAWHIPCRLAPVRTAYGGRSYERSQRWAEVAEADSRRALRTIADAPDEAARRGRRLQEYISESFSDRDIVRRCMEVFGR